jgi:hypothetical protein
MPNPVVIVDRSSLGKRLERVSGVSIASPKPPILPRIEYHKMILASSGIDDLSVLGKLSISGAPHALNRTKDLSIR